MASSIAAALSCWIVLPLGVALPLALEQESKAPLAIARAAPKTGASFAVSTSVVNDVRATLTVGGSPLPEIRHVVKSERTSKVVVKAADSRSASALEVTYGVAMASDDVVSDRPVDEIFKDQTYTVTRAADGVVKAERVVKDPTSGEIHHDEATGAELSVLHGDVAPLLLAQNLADGWAAAPIAADSKWSVPPALAQRLLPSELVAMEVKSLDLVASGARTVGAEECVVFRATLALVDQGEEGEELRIESSCALTGEMLVGRAHARLVSIDVRGALTMHGATDKDGAKKEVQGTGSIEWRWSARGSE